MRSPRHAGFTLVELMVVIVLVGLLAGTVGVAVWPILFKGEKGAVEAQLSNFKDALSTYKLQHHRYPTTLQDLVTPDPEHGFSEGYLDTEELPMDAWGEPYEYFSDGKGYEVFSKGPDTTPST